MILVPERATIVPNLLLEDQAAGAQAEPGGEDAVVGAGRPAALEVAEDDAAGLVAGLVLDQLGDGVADAAEPDVAEGVGLGGDGGRSPCRGTRPLRRRSTML